MRSLLWAFLWLSLALNVVYVWALEDFWARSGLLAKAEEAWELLNASPALLPLIKSALSLLSLALS